MDTSDLEIFIFIIISDPVLWDKGDKNVINKILKENASKKEAVRTNHTVSAAMDLYKAIREKYRRETIKQEQQTSGGTSSEKLNLYDLCSFWKDVEKPRNL